MKIPRYLSLLMALVEVATPLRALAQEAPVQAEPSVPQLIDTLRGMPKADYVSGKVLYEDGDFAGALVKFDSAYRASKDSRLLWNVAACHKALRHYAEVLRLLRRYKVEAGAYLTAADREDVQRLEEAIVPLVSSIEVTTSPADAELFLDGVAQGKLPLQGALFVDIGKRRLTLRKAGYKEQTRSVEVAGAENLRVQIVLEKVVTDGSLLVRAGAGDRILVDGKVVGIESWQGKLTRGAHSLAVRAPEKRPFYTEITIEPGRTRAVTVELEADTGGGLPGWVWITGGVLVAGGAAATGYLVLREPEKSTQQPLVGTIKPGTVHLP